MRRDRGKEERNGEWGKREGAEREGKGNSALVVGDMPPSCPGDKRAPNPDAKQLATHQLKVINLMKILPRIKLRFIVEQICYKRPLNCTRESCWSICRLSHIPLTTCMTLVNLWIFVRNRFTHIHWQDLWKASHPHSHEGPGSSSPDPKNVLCLPHKNLINTILTLILYNVK